MPKISLKNVLLVIVAVIILSRLNKVLDFFSGLYQFFYDALEPMRNAPVMGKYIVTLLILALLYISIFKYFYRKR